MLNEKELATVANRLQVPLIISDILAGEGELTDDVHYGLHAVISDLQPDSALLCIALAASTIASTYYKASPSMRILKLQCECIVDDYGKLWLDNAEDADVSEHDALEALSFVSEDLEGLGELIDLGIGFLEKKDKTATALLKILSIQAGAHSDIADEIFGALYTKIIKEEGVMPSVPVQ